METLFVRCSTRYSGRIDAELELSDVIINHHDNGTVLVHSCQGSIKARNWMPAGSTWSEREGLIVCEHEKRGERLDIYVETIYHRHEFKGELEGKLVTLGSEREVGDLLVDQLWRLGDGLDLVQREYRTDVGPLDILAVDQEGDPWAIEIKRGKVTSASVLYQIRRYTDALVLQERWAQTSPRGLLAAPSIGLAARALAAEMNIDCVLIRYDELAEHAGMQEELAARKEAKRIKAAARRAARSSGQTDARR